MQLRSKTNYIIVHCSDSPDSRADIGVKEIREWHIKERKWEDIGYHFVVKRDGTVETGRRENLVGAHTEGFNGKSISICWVGRDMPEPFQYAKLLKKVKDLMRNYFIPVHMVRGHKEFNDKKTCPNLDMDLFREHLKATSLPQNIQLTSAAPNITVGFTDAHLNNLDDTIFGKEESDV